MILSIANFIWIFITAFLTGFALCRLLIRTKLLSEAQLRLDVILLCGLASLTAYAQWFSIFYRVGILATLSLVFVDAAILLLFYKKIAAFFYTLSIKYNIYKYFLLFLVLGLFFAFVASTPIQIYDTNLYHNQAIQWIEKYGVVKGLGNLHNRLAYNSSFFALQALFSWSTIVGQSLHGMNSFLALFFSCYAVIGLFHGGKKAHPSAHPYIEQFFNALLLLQICTSISQISSPGTDFLPMMLILYIFSQWARDPSLSPFLFFMSLFALTAKLSAATMVIIGLPILYQIIRKHQYKQIPTYFFAGLYLVLPFLIRNVIISGYLLYPSTLFDFFQVDWKMPSYAVTFDHHEIISWGRSLRDVYKYDWPLAQWFPYWFQEVPLLQKGVFIGHAVLLPLSVLIILKSIIKKGSRLSCCPEIPYMLFISIIGLFAWFFSAPLIRYGNVYLYLLPAILLGYLLEEKLPGKDLLRYIRKPAALILLFFPIASYVPDFELMRVYNPSDYNSFQCSTYEIAPNITIYYPAVIPECTGYDTFPSTPYPKRLEVIELRGTSLEEGFRIKPLYQNTKLTPYGEIDP